MRKGLELLLALVVAVLVWLLFEFMVTPPLALAAVVCVGLGDKLGWVATGALAGAVAGTGVGLAPRWTRVGFLVGAAVTAAAGYGFERTTGLLAGQTYLGPGWAAFSLASFGGPMLEFVGWGPPPAGSRGLVARALGWEPQPTARLALRVGPAVVLGALVGGWVGETFVPPEAEYGPLGLRTAFAVGHVLVCCALRRIDTDIRPRPS